MTPLERLVTATLDTHVPPEISAMSDHLRAKLTGVAAILAYGSALRGVAAADTLIDLFVLVESDADVSKNPLHRLATKLVPPDVRYAECAFEGATLRCKYALIPLARFAGRMQGTVANPYFWARFAQPSRLVWALPGMEPAVVAAVAAAVETMYAASLSAAPNESDPLLRWQRGFEQTYRTELRPEGNARAREIIAANADFYRQAASLLGGTPAMRISWGSARAGGKFLSLLRLAKAAFTFEGGADYAAWKIERHTGKKIIVSDWQRRHPLLAGILMLPGLLRSRSLR
jgi:hypothetical protein